MLGIDVSTWNGRIDWNAVKKAGVKYAILRLGYGSNIATQDDNTFEYNYTHARAAGIPVGAYIYSYAANSAMAKSEAEHCIRVLKGKQLQLPVYIDFEEDSLANVARTLLLKHGLLKSRKRDLLRVSIQPRTGSEIMSVNIM